MLVAGLGKGTPIVIAKSDRRGNHQRLDGDQGAVIVTELGDDVDAFILHVRRAGGERARHDLPAHQGSARGAEGAGAGSSATRDRPAQPCGCRPYAESLRAVVTPLAGQTTRAIAKVLNEAGVKTMRYGRGSRRK